MKTSKFTDSQIMVILKQAEAGTPVPELCREHGISSAIFYKCRAKFGGMDASLMARLKVLIRLTMPCNGFGFTIMNGHTKQIAENHH
ncbi:transposase [Vibrio cholerae]|nr:transposase [Vibrio cholerae]